MSLKTEQQVRPIVIFAWKVAKMQRKFIGSAASEYNLTQNEKDVLLFLSNNPSLDTAGDIVNYRSISKALVAKSVKALTGRGFIQQRQDDKDGRYVHLEIMPAAKDAVEKLRNAQNEYQSALFENLNNEEQEELKRLLEVIMDTMDKYI